MEEKRFGTKVAWMVIRGISIVAAFGMIHGARRLDEQGYRRSAVVCVGLGVIELAEELIQIVIFWRKR